MKSLTFFTIIILAIFFSFSFLTRDKTSFSKTTSNDDYNFIDANRIKMWVSNNGDGSHDPETDSNGLYWAEGSAVFEDGLLWGCKINREIFVNGNTYRQGLQAGKILDDGTADDPVNPKYRVYKIFKHWRGMQPGSLRDAYQKDFEEWPVDDGAPWIDNDNDGSYDPEVDTPDFIGDQMLWFVSNDLDEQRSSSQFGAPPIGLEIQTKIFAFNNPGILGDIVFKNYRIINKSEHTLDSTFFAYWSDPDLGVADDDYVGCDTLLDLAFCYNKDDNDDFYNAPVPAVGYTLLGGLENKMTSFLLWVNTPWEVDWGSRALGNEYYKYLKGLLWNGNSIYDPHTDLPTRFAVPGDPVTQAGWYEGEGWPDGPASDDRKMLLSSGPYTILPGDEIDMTYAISVRRGTDHLDSITELLKAVKAAHVLYDNDFKIMEIPPQPKLNVYATDRRVNLYWENNVEFFSQTDLVEEGQTYNFEGYRIWQYSSPAGDEPQLLALFDIKNNLKVLKDYQLINGVLNDVTTFSLPNEGLQRNFNITYDQIHDERLRNGSPYYFAVTAFAFSESSYPRIIESKPQIITAVPGDHRIDKNYFHFLYDKMFGQPVNCDTDGRFLAQVIDPDSLTDHSYHVIVDTTDVLSWSLVDSTSGDTLIFKSTHFTDDLSQAYVFDGLKFTMQNQGKDSIEAVLYGNVNFAVKSVEQVADADGLLDVPIDVIDGMNSSGEWSIKSFGASVDNRQNINWADHIGLNNYEIRFTGTGSEFYLSGYFLGLREPVLRDEPKAKNKVPFEIWDISRDLESTDDDIRLIVKIRDENKIDTSLAIIDSSWSQLDNGDWEPVYGYYGQSDYSEPLPESSGRSNVENHPIGRITFNGELPETGTIIRITTWKPLEHANTFSMKMTPATENDYTHAKDKLDDISIFPNPYYGSEYRQNRPGQGFVRITNLPQRVTIRIYTIAGGLALKAEKDNPSPWWDWNLRNQNGLPVASGIFLIHLDMPKIGAKILKAAIVQDNYTIQMN